MAPCWHKGASINQSSSRWMVLNSRIAHLVDIAQPLATSNWQIQHSLPFFNRNCVFLAYIFKMWTNYSETNWLTEKSRTDVRSVSGDFGARDRRHRSVISKICNAPSNQPAGQTLLPNEKSETCTIHLSFLTPMCLNRIDSYMICLWYDSSQLSSHQ